jgi:tRNA threonylcarbamoyladenosine biosynthesis protein TsaB
MALILCMETATPLCSVALVDDGVVIAEREELSERHIHAERINVFIQQVMTEAGRSLSDLDAVAVGRGPGSYTGLRIGLSTAKGLCYALGLPLLGISTLEVMREVARARGALPARLWPMVDARRNEVFTACFGPEGPLTTEQPRMLDEQVVRSMGAEGDVVVCGPGADRHPGLWTVTDAPRHLPGILPHARALWGPARLRLLAGDTDDLAYMVPRYGKDARPTPPRSRAQ